jgi:hypothetical protein
MEKIVDIQVGSGSGGIKWVPYESLVNRND